LYHISWNYETLRSYEFSVTWKRSIDKRTSVGCFEKEEEGYELRTPVPARRRAKIESDGPLRPCEIPPSTCPSARRIWLAPSGAAPRISAAAAAGVAAFGVVVSLLSASGTDGASRALAGGIAIVTLPLSAAPLVREAWSGAVSFGPAWNGPVGGIGDLGGAAFSPLGEGKLSALVAEGIVLAGEEIRRVFLTALLFYFLTRLSWVSRRRKMFLEKLV
jgi:hypothetical protein